MSSRLPTSLAASLSSLRITPTVRTFSTTPSHLQKQKRETFNPHAAAAAKKCKNTNLARQAELRQQRAAAAVDPVLGLTTSFLESLDTVPPPLPSVDAVLSTSASSPSPEQQRLNHFIAPLELPEFLRTSHALAAPYPVDDDFIDPDLERAFQRTHEHSVEAIRRILALGNGNSADRTRANKQVCINLFGRHVTDSLLPKDPGTPEDTGKTPRAGPDTGSSEVQVAILTVKIRALAKALHRDDGHNTKDKHNKRNLRLMVHRRQKLLKYLKRKEKGGVRYRNVLEALGLDNGAVEKELFL
ncbi:hypothetical protein BDD12DRAFT_850170 [Trichophaea hybrida]|nr:hypothetical protein BDD12DRAFT_850170 [Trichophaea hybrida]